TGHGATGAHPAAHGQERTGTAHAGHAQGRPAGSHAAGHGQTAASAPHGAAHGQSRAPASHAEHGQPRAAGAVPPGEGTEKLLTLVQELVQDPVVQRRIQNDSALREAWTDPGVRRIILQEP
ncbi:MAG TPA: hypothetical protein VGR37_21910, partial [Longimicrobiaceae bacterium]|nr:hypothetical protein [Longimicrobiaceae bacterium]